MVISDSKSQPRLLAENEIAAMRALVLIPVLVLICSGIFLFARLIILSAYTPADLPLNGGDLWHAFWIGFRFDVAVVVRITLLGFILSILALALPRRFNALAEIVWRINLGSGYCLLLLAVFFSVVNVGYISFFNRPIDSFVFEGLSYGVVTSAKSIYGLENFFWALAIGTATAIASLVIYTRLWRLLAVRLCPVRITTRLFIIGLLIPVVLLALLARGTISTFPLSYRHLAISSDTAINNLVPNGLIGLYYGHRQFRKSKKLSPADDAIGRQLFEQFYSRIPTQENLFPQFFTLTRKSELLTSQPPHVVLNIVEGMSQALLTARFNNGLNLAGAMKPHLADDLYFENFLPASNGTQESLVGLLINSQYVQISRSKYQHVSLLTASAKVFKDAGYKTIFIYSGFEGIVNRAAFFKTQGFDEFIGAHRLKTLFPSMQSSVWGGEDSYIFEHAWQLLNNLKADSQPHFIVNLTVTNHPPYHMPVNTLQPSIEAPASLTIRLQNLPPESLDSYRYTNDHLGHFISRVKQGHGRDNTIIAVTGDHSIRGMKYDRAEQLHQLAVPFYLYLPDQYQPSTPIDQRQIASHKDIMPTLFHAALSEASYVNLGRNLLVSTPLESPHNFAYHRDYLIVQNGAYNNSDQATLSGHQISSSFDLTTEPAVATSEVIQRVRSYPKILDWLTRYQLDPANQSLFQ